MNGDTHSVMRHIAFLFCFLVWTAQAADHFQHISLSHSGRFVAMQDPDGSAWVMDMSSGSRKTISKASHQAMTSVWTPDDKYVVATGGAGITSYTASSGRIFRTVTGSSPVTLTDISPDGRTVSFVRDHNLWTASLEGKLIAKPLTEGGNHNLLIGTPDPVYGQEFDVSQHYWWSPDSSSVAYIETEFQDENHYVFPGAKLPTFRLKIFDIASGKSRLVTESNDDWSYILRVAWQPGGKQLVFYRMNRVQNLAELCSFDGGVVKTLLTEKDAYWVNAPETPVFVADGKRMVVSSERSGARHVYLYELGGQLVTDLTPADLEVYHLHKAEDGKHVYVTGSNGSRQEQQLFRLSLDGTPMRQVTGEAGWHEVSLDATGDAYLDYHSTVLKAPSVDWHDAAGGRAREIVAAPVDDKPVANEFISIKTHDNVPLPARLFKPDDFDSQKKYPVILYTFSGPRGRVVMDDWGGWQMAWNRSMVRQGYLVLAVDVRGSGGYGHLFEEYIHYRFGAQETADIREVVSYLRRQSYVDGDRLGIWGCDYGAHIVVHAMWQFPGGFKAGFADSPIADWRKYDAYFTERYLGLPARRFIEYQDSTALEDARRMSGTLLVAARPDDALIRPEHVQALQQAIADVKRNKEVAKRFQVVALPDDLEKRKAQMTEFFRQTL